MVKTGMSEMKCEREVLAPVRDADYRADGQNGVDTGKPARSAHLHMQ